MSLFGPPSAKTLTKRLFSAIDDHNIDKLREALDAGADIESTPKSNSAHRTPLYAAVHGGFTEAVQVLLERGAQVDKKRRYDGHTALMEAARDGSYRIAELLIEKGADVNAAQSDDSKTALHLAAAAGRGDVVKLLLRHGARLDMLDSRMNTAADLADKDHPRLADFLRAQQGGGQKAPAEPAAATEGWHLTAADEVARIDEKPLIGYRITEIFNFGAGVYNRIARNLSTDHESQSMRLFDEMQGSALLQQAADAYVRLGGDADKIAAAASLTGKKPAGLTMHPSGRNA